VFALFSRASFRPSREKRIGDGELKLELLESRRRERGEKAVWRRIGALASMSKAGSCVLPEMVTPRERDCVVVAWAKSRA